MAAQPETEIERKTSSGDLSGDLSYAGHRQSQISTVSSRARAFVKTLSDQEVDAPRPTKSLSFSLDLMNRKDPYDDGAGSHILTSPASDISMHPNINSVSLENRHRLDLNLTPIHSTRQTVDLTTPPISSPEARDTFEFVEYKDIDSEQKMEFERLLKSESGCSRSWLHKGLIVNIGFFVVMVLGVVLGEVYFPLEGVRGRGVPLMNDTRCSNNQIACFSVRIIRAVGIFGLVGGVTNWIAIEMLFRSVPFLFGTGVFAKKYMEIRTSIKKIVVETLFDPLALKQYFTGRQKNLREIFQLENHFGGLLESSATSMMVDKKIDYILGRPEGFVLTMMGVDHRHLKIFLKEHVHSFIQDLSPTVLDSISSSGLTDGVGLQAEVEKILEERTEDLTSTKVRQLMSAMIRKHLNWLIAWGNILGALAGLLAEVISILVARYTNT